MPVSTYHLIKLKVANICIYSAKIFLEYMSLPCLLSLVYLLLVTFDNKFYIMIQLLKINRTLHTKQLVCNFNIHLAHTVEIMTLSRCTILWYLLFLQMHTNDDFIH